MYLFWRRWLKKQEDGIDILTPDHRSRNGPLFSFRVAEMGSQQIGASLISVFFTVFGVSGPVLTRDRSYEAESRGIHIDF